MPLLRKIEICCIVEIGVKVCKFYRVQSVIIWSEPVS